MAEETIIPIKVNIGGVEKTISNIKELQKARKELTEASLFGDQKAAKSLAELKDKFGDLADAAKTAQGSGIEKLSGSFGLLKESVMTADFDKFKTGLSGVGAAMKAIPIFLIIEGLTKLYENFDKLKESGGIIGTIFRGIGDAIDYATGLITKFTDAIGLTNSALEEQGEAIKKNSDASIAALNAQTSAYDRQIAVAKAAGKSTIELEKQKQEAIVQTNVQIAKQIEAFVRAGGQLDDEKKKQLTASLEAIKAARTQEAVAEITDQKEKAEKYKEWLQKQFEAFNKGIDERKKKEAELLAYEQYLNTIRVDIQKLAGEEHKKIEDEELRVTTNEVLPGLQMGYQDHFEKRKQSIEEWVLANNTAIQTTSKVSQDSIAATQNLSDTVFAIRMAKVKKGSEEEEKLARRQFQINKGLQLANATIQGTQAVLAAFASGAATPLIGPATGAIYAGFAAAAAAANIAKIAATQFNPSGGGGGDVSAPSISNPNVGPVNTGAPSSTFAPPTQQTTRLNEAGEVVGRTVKAVVVETDMTSKQRRVNRLENQSTF